MPDNQRHQPIELAKSYRLLNHGPVTIVTSSHNGERNIMAAAWAMPLDFDPPKVAVVIDRNTWTRELIEASGRFALNIPTRAIASQVLAVGASSGREGDKFAALGLETFTGSSDLPLVAGCAGWLECRILPEDSIQQRYDLFLAEVTAAWADPQLYSDGRWHFPTPDSRTLHYIAGGAFFVTGDELAL
ncbi:flavin reductase family protein [Paludibacterium purpuratum]|uniref:Flavin reductase (DIM6/NTAB) family NADH-FMN oxidoreductase RutF n=1 Tax=Paludibacterium purpuratum TaxID=1144873 RepID=A0A4R7AWT0_9NEIS|nr:flavin reductase family protein [Paludibacterium purpuratum]TDR72008.1 flavin reductase (DIM6/NTAB) family NADH-FMN oxidoreductase RutF [Paludibacterium purpuratum]